MSGQTPEGRRASSVKWRAENRERLSEYLVKWRAENPEKAAASAAKYRAENHEKVLTAGAKWRAENPEKIRASAAKWRAENPEKVRASAAKWRAENPDSAAASNAKYRAENRERLSEYKVKWRAENHERLAAAHRADPRLKMWQAAKFRAKSQGVPFTITVEDIVIPTHCPVLGIPLFSSSGSPGPNSPTLDKIIPPIGYTPPNTRVISHRANALKSNATAAELRAVLAYVEREAA